MTEALEAWLNAHPDDLEARCELGAALLLQGRYETASLHLAQVLQRAPDHPRALHNLAAALRSLGRLDAAEVVYRRLLGTGAAGPTSHADYAQLLLQTQRPEEALFHLSLAKGELPEDPGVNRDLAHALMALGRWREAVPLLERNLALEPDEAERTWSMSVLHLLSGDWRRGWQGFESRWRTRERRTPLRHFDAPPWDGSPLQGRRLMLWAEQGLGDTLLALRYLPRLRSQTGWVGLEVQHQLRPLIDPHSVDTVVYAGEPLPPFDVHLPLMSLPGWLQDEPDTQPFTPYVRVPSEVPHQDVLDARLASLGEGMKVGLVWRGGDAFAYNHLRSLPDDAVKELMGRTSVQWVGLQAGTPCPWPVALDLGPELQDFASTAYVLSTLDQVITVDTATANLAGALGCPAWVLLHFAPDWRWMLGGESTPWYPTLRLFRQPKAGDWATVITRVAAALERGT